MTLRQGSPSLHTLVVSLRHCLKNPPTVRVSLELGGHRIARTVRTLAGVKMLYGVRKMHLWPQNSSGHLCTPPKNQDIDVNPQEVDPTSTLFSSSCLTPEVCSVNCLLFICVFIRFFFSNVLRLRYFEIIEVGEKNNNFNKLC